VQLYMLVPLLTPSKGAGRRDRFDTSPLARRWPAWRRDYPPI
jgi:hypothetical protein